MNNLGAAITGILGRTGRKYSDLVKASGISKSALSQLVAGAPCSPANLGRLVAHIGADPEMKAELVKAHLLDELDRANIPPGLVHILTAAENRAGDLRGQLSAEIYGWLATLGYAIASGNKEFEGIVEELAHLAHRFQARTNTVDFLAAEDANEYPGTPAKRHPFPGEDSGA